MIGSVFADAVALGLVGFDGDDVGAEAGALHRDGPRARAHVPDGAAGSRAEPGQHQRADLRLGDHRVAVLELVLGQGPAVRGARVAGQPARACFRGSRIDRDEDIGLGECAVRCRAQVGDAFGGGAEAFRDVYLPSRGQQLSPDFVSRPGRGQDRDLGVGERGGEGPPRIAAVGCRHEGVVPVQAQPGERQRDRGHRRDDCGPDAAGAQGADDPEEARVAGGQHRDLAGARARHDGVERVVEALELQAFGLVGDVGRVQVPGGTDDEGRGGEGGGGLGDRGHGRRSRSR